MKIKSIPLSQLIPSPSNVRKTGSGIGIMELAASIEAHGLLQNLQVREAANGKYEVVAGGRRHAALKLLAKRKALPKDAAVACNLLDGEDATEISLAENEMRKAMHPADQFEAWKALIDAGHGLEDIAARFGVAPTVVRQRLKLAAVSPKLMALYRDAEMTLDQLMAFTVSDDHAAQEAAWFDVPEWQRKAHAIRQALTAAHVRADDKRARFVTVEAYVAAGGHIIADLFQTESEGYLTVPALLDRLVAEKLEREAGAVREEGWKWVEIVSDFSTLPSFGEVKGKRQPLPPKTVKTLAKLEQEADRLRAMDELTDEELERLEALEAEIGTLSTPVYVWSDRQKTRAGALLSIGHDGALIVERGLIRPADMKPAKPNEAEVPDEADHTSRPSFSSALAGELTAHRTAALRAVLADRPEVALAAAVHALLLPVFYGSDGESGLAIHATAPALRAEGMDDSPAAKRLAERHTAWVAQLPEDGGAVWDWLLTQDNAALTGLLAYCVACTVEPQGGGHVSQLAAAVSLDMAQWWHPTVAGYLGRVPKPLIIEAVTEGKGAFEANCLAGLKKTEMAGRAAELLTGTGWLPAMLKAA
ncbi:ParB/RepB/Spo0J family partition protein [Acidisphaera sp. S103]|uniref:ParB/RepB/Spo0J family partition protein n=1 Tax=Acidisphaera sp. S103 TaxID=1747223 RepID=UPI00131E6C31|nr:ParB/RepB/Spo0J family partition protein [Acidisphaera sp. S103]